MAAVAVPRVSVVMPVHRQAAFVGRAIGSLLAQRLTDWELVVVDDGSPDGSAEEAARFAADPRVRVVRLPANAGLGAACNAGLDRTTAPLVAYLPADDLLYPDHLAALAAALEPPGAVLAVSGVRYHGGAESLAAPEGFAAQLVQVMHRRTGERWVERAEQESDDLDRLYWARLRRHGGTVTTGRVTCEWVDHPAQRHKAIRESLDGGLNVFRSRYAVPEPLRFHSTDSGEVDEVALYAPFRERRYPAAAGGLRVLLAGELSYNPERVLALAARGHTLLGTWTGDGLGMSTVGPLPFGHVEEVGGDPVAAVRAARPDVVYGLLNWRAVPFGVEVLRAARAAGVPFVWHFKESPQRSIARGEWPLLAELATGADALVTSTVEEAEWFALALPGRIDPARTLVVDGDLPAAHWLPAPGQVGPRRSGQDGELRTVVVGRALGIDAEVVRRLAATRVHLHVHGAVRAPGPKGEWASWVGDVGPAAAGYLHLHPPVHQDGWAAVLGRYDAGWLHRVPSANGGDLRRASWDDLNAPARLGPLAVAGLPMLQQAHPGHNVAADRLVRDSGAGLLYRDLDDLADQLHRPGRLDAARAAMLAVRRELTFDHHVPLLDALFRSLAGAG